MNKNHLIATVAGFAALAATIVGTTTVVQIKETERFHACVDAGGSYVLTASGEGRECRR